ncbi:carbohydrate ABC transporter permease [Acholeplasma equifetale]|uniref:carbohydrate ABC transporter permease n=1 Tax=Acholeplasma equifetale TaxID=264634 RepID=UPI00047B1536|nr:carbohydrate ABC transporter permease [Acholeplasma equifetale]
MTNINWKQVQSKTKRFLFGMNFMDGFVFKFIIYFLLVIIGFVFVYPLLVMLSFSLMSLEDLINPMVSQIPTTLYFNNYVDAFIALDYIKVFFQSLVVTLIPAIIQTFIASLVGYGFARFEFPLKKFWMVLVVVVYMIPPQVYLIPRFVLFHNMGLLNNIGSVLVPTTFGQGLNSSIFILIFYQFYKMIPKALDEAAQIDGASRLYIYFKIAIPLSIPSFITSFLFSFVWQWNETYQTFMFLGDGWQTLQTRLAIFVSAAQGNQVTLVEAAQNEAQAMAGNILIMIPMLIVYLILQKQFIEGIDKSGITGE